MIDFESLKARILPIPKKVELTAGQPLVLTDKSKFCVTAPQAEFGPVKGANEKLEAFLKKFCGENCLADDGIKLTLTIGEPTCQVKFTEGGYTLDISAEGITITGFDPTGLLYGVITLTQLCVFDINGCTLPALTVTDWPENLIRGIKAECRYGSNVMEQEDWLNMLDELLEKKMNFVNLALYGCWVVQYDGRVSEYLYMPVKNHPELKTPMVVKYFSPEENRWIDTEKLPALFVGDNLDAFFRRARDLGIKICPSWNSFGHNTLVPAMIPEVSAKEEDGVTPTLTGFCTSNEETYKLLFSIYDQIIDDYMIPYGMDMFCTVLDEVHDGVGMHAEDPKKMRSPWCKCEKCKDQDKGDIFINHAVKTTKYLKERGVKSVIMACDMLLTTRRQSLGWLGDRLMEAMDKAGLRDVLLVDWWAYFDIVDKMYFDNVHPELGLRTVNVPWNGYYDWCLLTNPMRCVQHNAEMNYRDGGEGMYIYATWEKSYDRIHDAHADYCWDYKMTGSVDDVTDRYVRRHFGSRFAEARHAYELIDWITEERIDKWDEPWTKCISNFNMLLYRLSYYTYSYVSANLPYPRNFPGEPLGGILKMRRDLERAMYSIASMSKEAIAIFKDLAVDPTCDMAMADRMAYECENYLCLVEDWLTLLKIYDITQSGDQKTIAPLARARQHARLELMAHCEKTKEKFVVEALTMRNHSIFMKMFDDIAAYIESTDTPELDILNAQPIMSEKFFELR